MNMKNLLLSAFMLCATFASGQIFAEKTFKGLYINKFDEILGNPAKEDSVLNYIYQNRFNSISLYDLHKVHFDSTPQVLQLASFIRRARLMNVTRVGATAENAWFMENRIIPYNQSQRSAASKFNVLNLEFEFWNEKLVESYYCPTYLSTVDQECTMENIFRFYIEQLTRIKTLAVQNKLETEVYLGWFTLEQARLIMPLTNRILLHSYTPHTT